MADPKLLRTCDLDPSEIDTSGRLRPVSILAVDTLVASIEELGEVLDAVHLREVRRKGKPTVLRLMAGGHRVEACRRLGRTVPAKVWSCDDDWARMLELDDNLASAELAPLDMAVFLAERQALYQKLHPETKQGVPGALARWHAADTVSAAFSQVMAASRGWSDRHVRRVARAGAMLSREDVEKLRFAGRPILQKDLLALAKTGDEAARAAAIDRFASGEVPTLAGAVRAAAEAAAGPVAPKDPLEEALKNLKTAWKRAPLAARKRFLRDTPSIADLLDEGAP